MNRIMAFIRVLGLFLGSATIVGLMGQVLFGNGIKIGVAFLCLSSGLLALILLLGLFIGYVEKNHIQGN